MWGSIECEPSVDVLMKVGVLSIIVRDGHLVSRFGLRLCSDFVEGAVSVGVELVKTHEWG